MAITTTFAYQYATSTYELTVDRKLTSTTARWLQAQRVLRFRTRTSAATTSFFIYVSNIPSAVTARLNRKFNTPATPVAPVTPVPLTYAPTLFRCVNDRYELVIDARLLQSTREWLHKNGAQFSQVLEDDSALLYFSVMPDAVRDRIAAKHGCLVIGLPATEAEIVGPQSGTTISTSAHPGIELVNSIDKQCWLVSFFVKNPKCTKTWTEGGMWEADLVKTELYEDWYLAIRNAINWKDSAPHNTYAINELWPGIDPLDSEAAFEMDNDIQVLRRVLQPSAA